MQRQELEKRMSELKKEYGLVWAFSKEQFNEQKEEGKDYVALGAGGYIPKENAKPYMKAQDELLKEYKEKRLERMGKKKLIHYELANHECQISYDYDCVVAALAGYGITEQDVADEWQEFLEKCENW